MRWWLLVLMGILGGSVLAQDVMTPETKVTWTKRACNAPSMVEWMASQTNIPMEATAGLADTILVLKVKELPLKDVMARMAVAANAEWVSREGKLFLKPIPSKPQSKKLIDARKQKIRSFIDERLKSSRGAVSEDAVRKRLQELRRLEGNEPGAPTDWRRYEILRQQSAIAGFNWELLNVADLDAIARMVPGDRIVFSNKPTQLQKPFGSDVSAFIDKLTEQKHIEDKINVEMAAAEDNEIANLEVPRVLPSQIAKVLLVVEIDRNLPSLGNRITTRAIPVSETGSYQQFGFEWSVIDLTFGAEGVNMTQIQEVMKPQEGDVKFVKSAESGAFTKLLQSGYGSTRRLSDEEIKQWLPVVRDPEKHEPLSYAATDFLFQLADVKKANLLMSVPDAMATMSGSMDDMSFRAFETLINTTLGGSIGAHDGWLILDVQSEFSGLPYTDRSALGALVRSAEKEKRITFEMAADYAYRSGGYNPMPFLHPYLAVAVPEFNQGFFDMNHDALRLYGSLSIVQRDLLRQGQSILVQSLKPDQISIVRSIIYGASPRLRPVPKPNTDLPPDSPATADEADEYYFATSIATEPTEVLSNGIPPKSTLDAARRLDVRVMSYKSDRVSDNEYAWARSPEEIGQELFYQSDPVRFPWVVDNPKLEYFSLVEQTELKLTIRCGDVYAPLPIRLKRSTPEMAKRVRLNDLPSDVRARIEAARARAKKDAENYNDEDSPGGNRKPSAP